MKKQINGIIAPMITPFNSDGTINMESAKKEAEFLISAGVDGISPGGSTGEGSTLSDKELFELVSMIRSLSLEIAIIAGVIRNSTSAALSAALAAKKAGADALMVTPVSYYALVPDDEGNYLFYKEISEKSGLPVIIYNVVPQNVVSVELYIRLLKLDNIIGIKQSVGGVMAFYEMKVLAENIGKVFAATDEMLFTCFELGASGAISAIITAFPELCVKMWNYALNGKYDDGANIQKRLYPVWRTISGNQFPIRLKYALHMLGRESGYTRSPICYLSEYDKEEIRIALIKAKLI